MQQQNISIMICLLPAKYKAKQSVNHFGNLNSIHDKD